MNFYRNLTLANDYINNDTNTVDMFYQYFGLTCGIALIVYGFYIALQHKGNLLISKRKTKIIEMTKFSTESGVSMILAGLFIVILELMLRFTSINFGYIIATLEIIGVLVFVFRLSVIQSKYTIQIKKSKKN